MSPQFYVTVVGATQGTFKSEGTAAKLIDKIPGVAFSYGVINPHDAASGAASGKRHQQPVIFTKQWGISSPQFYKAAYTNEILTSVLFQFMATLPDGTESLDHTVKLTNATISSARQWLQIGQMNGPPVDSRDLHEISFHFQNIEIISLAGHTEAADDWQATH